MLMVNITFSQTPNFSNMHNVITNKKATCVKMSSNKVFFGTNDVSDKGLYMYDVNTGVKTTIDTSYGVRNMTRVIYMSQEYFVICTDYFGFTIDNNGNKVGTFIMNASGGFYDVVWNPNQQKLYWGCAGKIMYSNWNFGSPTSVVNPFFSTNLCIVKTLECNSDTIYIGYYSTTQNLRFIKYYNYSYVSGSNKTGDTFCTDMTMYNGNYFISMCYPFVGSGNGIMSDLFPSNYCMANNYSNFSNSAIETIGSNLWIAPTLNKIFKYNGTTSPNLLNGNTYSVPTVDTIYDMEIDMSGQMWVASKNGLHTTANINIITTNIHIDIKNVEFNVYPNPNNGEFKINLEKEVDMFIYNVTGQEVYKQVLFSGDNYIKLENVKAGYYIIILKGSSSIIGTKKIIIQ